MDRKTSPTNSGGRRNLSNTALCPMMRPFGTLAEVMRIKNIGRIDLIKGVAYMTLDEPINGRREGILHIGDHLPSNQLCNGEPLKIRSQDQYEKYKDHLEKYTSPWTFEELRQRAQELSQEMFQNGLHRKAPVEANQQLEMA